MNNRKIFNLILIMLLVSSSAYLVSSTPSETSVTKVNGDALNIDAFSGLSRPIFVSSDGVLTRERNETLGHGATIHATVNNDITLTYKVVNGINTTAILLFADLPGNYSLTNSSETLTFEFIEDSTQEENFTLPYDNGIEIIHTNVSYYKVEINVSIDFVPFYAAIGSNSEDALNSPRNLLTTNQYWKTFSDEEFFTQDENVTISLVANDTNVNDVFGIAYKDGINSFKYENYTLVADGANSLGTIDLEIWDPGTTIYWETIAYVQDTVLNEVRKVERLDYQFVEIADGTPVLELNITSGNNSLLHGNTFYSAHQNVTFEFLANVPKGNITHFEILANETTTPIIASTNASLIGENMNTTLVFGIGRTNVTIFAYSTKDLTSNQTYLVIIDQTNPTANLELSAESPIIKSTDGEVTFTFDFNDTLAGVKEVWLDLGDGLFIEVSDRNSYTHRYVGFNDTQFFTITLTVIDWAGNEIIDVVSVQIEFVDNIETTSAPYGAALIVFFVILILIFATPLWWSKFMDLTSGIRDKFKK
jgi:hypothetical protein